MWNPKISKPLVMGIALVYGAGYGTGYFKDVPTKAISLLVTASSTSTVNFSMTDMVNHSKQYDLRPPVETRRALTTIPSST
jgi:hypothetical protein